jgi:thiamine pyrophosphate-dependent acetolactate synthase large subunit-like protein
MRSLARSRWRSSGSAGAADISQLALHLGPGLANGLANIHNANKAMSGMVNIVGDHATYQRQYDAPLTSDIEGLARPNSHWVKTSPDSRGSPVTPRSRSPPRGRRPAGSRH